LPVKIKVVEGAETGCIYVLAEGESKVFGRHPSADVVIPDPLLSRHHLMVRAAHGGCLILDLDSSNGTFLNGQLVKEAPVQSGDRVAIGNVMLEVEIDTKPRPVNDRSSPETIKALRFCSRCHRAVLLEKGLLLAPWELFVCEACRAGKTFDPYLIDSYKLVQQVGSGPYGPTYRAEHLGLKRQALVKLIAPGKSVDPKLMQLFIREASIGGRLSHPNIVEMYDAGEKEGVFYIIEEWVEGTELKRRLEESGALAAPEALAIGERVAEALRFAHEQGVVHRNVNPGSICLGPGGAVKLADFGLAKMIRSVSGGVSGITAAGELKGTANYTPPEQLLNAATADQRADIYALGATLYHMVAGKPPYEAASPLKVIRRIGEGDLVPLADLAPQLPRSIRLLIERAMERDPNRRFQRVEELLAGIASLRG
jgi:serine/threonine protein kinase